MSGLRIDVADLLAHPGTRRACSVSDELDGLATSIVAVDGPIEVDVTLEHVADGIVVRGTVKARWAAECSVCLVPLTEELAAAVDELFEPHPVDGETYLLEGHELDLEQLARDAVVIELPLAPHCNEPCEADVVLDAASDADIPSDDERNRDPRWAALSELEL